MHLDELATKVGEELGVTGWISVEQDRVDLFADATGDHQWIHVDAEKAASGPFGATIAHGYLTLSMMPIFLGPFMEFDGVAMSLNYGVDKVRFPHPVRVGSKVRARVSVVSVEEKPQGILLTMGCVVEIDGVDKPACVAQPLALLVRG
ncbi:MaoC family dehydratase [Streptomyces sp. JH14]|uniref:MaoC family dehydratase n=1 Tax=Streptomyces sp. JH14 TaxID=2793630 RepID=UPI0023F69FDC|nr:MaoC family dehydratase [Streptomyces sp. JH14]MDF6046129.1 MaoC family dehydratase [Streptomyces sp. JH14]